MEQIRLFFKHWYNLMDEIKFQLGELHHERIDKDDFINAIEQIYWHYTEVPTKDKQYDKNKSQ